MHANYMDIPFQIQTENKLSLLVIHDSDDRQAQEIGRDLLIKHMNLEPKWNDLLRISS